jgi:YggT family protein
MIDLLAALAVLTSALRIAFLAGGVALATVAVMDWSVRTRRLNPFGGVARFMRARVDPRLAGVERQVTRAGGHPASTPWWALMLYVVIALLILAGAGMIAGLVQEAYAAAALGPLGILGLVLHWIFTILRLALLLRVIASWIPRLATRRWVSWSFPATDWLLRPLRRVIPPLGVIDITPIVAYFALQILEWLLDTILLGGIQ